MRYAQLVMGPAGSGKSTYCSTIAKYAADEGKTIDVVNLDPAAEHFSYQPLADIRELIHLDDAMEDEDLNFGPNGGLIYCMEYLVENSDWLQEALGDIDDDYLLFDCPGQIELYTHMTVFRQLLEKLHNLDFRVCAVFLMDAQFMVDGAKFVSGVMAALSGAVNLEIPSVHILSKMDQLSKSARGQLDRFLDPDTRALLCDVARTDSKWDRKYERLTRAIADLVEDFSLVRFCPLDPRNPESIATVLYTVNTVIQHGEDSDVKTRDFGQEDQVEDDKDGPY